MTGIAPRSIIAAVLGGQVDMNPPPRDMHRDLVWWHVMFEGGHNIVTVADPGNLGTDPSVQELTDLLVPAPIRTVERIGWRIVNGFVVAPLPIDPVLGLVVPDEDEEHVSGPAATDGVPLTRLSVGEPYPNRLPWQDSAAHLSIQAQGVDFILPLRQPTESEVHAFGKGDAEFAILPTDRFVLWLYRFTNPKKSGNPAGAGPGLPWSDTPWEFHRQTTPRPALPGAPGTTFVMQLTLVDADTNIVRALRTIAPSVEFADAVRSAITRQAGQPNETLRAGAEIQGLYARHPNSADLLPLAEARFEALRNGSSR
ncbi:hypothetical protein [Streptomyces goshikiensis]|uniref:hypothetical protein n=1 Tax=Streptomyces goshikiensis TaxID=1942 RepID=UPI0036BDF2F4